MVGGEDRVMEETPKNGNESSQSPHVNVMNE
jgi:hypothetical protein